MNHSKKILLSLIGFLSFQFAEAQDKLFKVNGDVMEVKVTEIGDRIVSFKRADNPQGPGYTISRNEIEKIQFENGTTDYFNTRRTPVQNSNGRTAKREVYGNNIISFAPVQMTNTSATGIGIHYEHFVDKKGMFSIYVPLAFSFRNEDYRSGPYNNDQVFSRVFWTYPGLKIYPTGSNKKISYGVGPSLAIGAGTVPSEEYDPSTGYYINKNESIFQFGMMVNNSLNIQPTPKLYLGLELGLGIPYIHTNSGAHNYDDGPLAQFNFKIGYRF